MEKSERNKNKDIVSYSFAEEVTNAITHWIGCALGIAALVILIVYGVKNSSPRQIVGFSIYGSCFIFMFLSSAIYHSIPGEKAKSILRVLDHSSIFIFIAGTYTPITLLSLKGTFSIVMLVFVWIFAFSGILFKIFTYGKFSKYKKISLSLYLGFGWISMILIPYLVKNRNYTLILFLALGGICYSIGSYFYANRKIAFNHAIWHIFVLAAGILHFFGILLSYAL